MNIISLIFLITIFFYIINLLISESDQDFLEKRLMKLSKKKDNFIQEDNLKKSEVKQVVLEQLKPMIHGILKQNKKKTIKQILLEAGLPSGDEDVFKFMANKIMLAVFGLILGWIIAAGSNLTIGMKLLLCFIIPLSCYILPDFRIKRIIKKRADEITYNLPDALDLLTVCVEAGLGLDAALAKVSQEQARTAPVLARELGRVSKDIQAGIFRHEAFRNLAIRNNVPDLKTFAALLIQTDKLGTSIAQSLRTYSDTTRTKRRQRVEALAQQASVKMVIPLVLFILPVIMVVLIGPAALSLIKTLKGSGI